MPEWETTCHYYRPIHTTPLTATCVLPLLHVHCKQAMNAIYHNARTICPLRYKMKMSCYFLAQDAEKRLFSGSARVVFWAIVTVRIKTMTGQHERLSHLIISWPHFLVQCMYNPLILVFFTIQLVLIPCCDTFSVTGPGGPSLLHLSCVLLYKRCRRLTLELMQLHVWGPHYHLLLPLQLLLSLQLLHIHRHALPQHC